MYCTIDDIKNRVSEQTLVQLTTDTGSEPDAVLVGQFIAEATAYVNTFLSPRYVVPVTDIRDLDVIRPITVSLIVPMLYARRNTFAGQSAEELSMMKRIATDDLRRIQSGEMVLPSYVQEQGTALVIKSNKRHRRFQQGFLS